MCSLSYLTPVVHRFLPFSISFHGSLPSFSMRFLPTIPHVLCLTLLLGSLIGCGSPPDPPPDGPSPNVLVLLSDDQGWGDYAQNGNRDLAMPNLDRLADEGAIFDRFYVQPVCSPTRAEFLTGRYHVRGGVHSTSAGGERLDPDEATIAEAFQSAGYATGVFGKWHNGTQYPYHPNARGFDEFYGFTSGHWGHYFSPPLEHNERLVQGSGYLPDDLTDRAMSFIASHADDPFFVYVPYNIPHSPMQVPDRFYEKFADREIEMPPQDADRYDEAHARAAYAMTENIDWNVGRLLDHLDALGIADNTIVLYFGDNGPNGWRWNGGLRGRKGSTDEGGVRSPLFVRWPERIEPGARVSTIAAAIDLLPTLVDAAGIERVGEKPLDGVSLMPVLDGLSDGPADRRLFSHWNDRVSVHTQQFVLDDQERLYDVETDPGQTVDVTEEHPDKHAELAAAVRNWREDVLSELPAEDDRPFPVGYPEYPVTHLPARDADAHGGIERSNRYPNDSFFRNWTSTEGRITWDVEVRTSGRYRAVVHYTCPEADLGSTVTLSFGEAAIDRVVDEAHDPPLLGAEYDRVARQESYVKDFRPMELGVIDLEAGRGTLTLGARDVPASQVMDVRRVTLTLLDE